MLLWDDWETQVAGEFLKCWKAKRAMLIGKELQCYKWRYNKYKMIF